MVLPATQDRGVTCACRTSQQALLTAPWPLELLSHPKACICTAKANAVTAKTAQYLQPSEVLLRGLRVRMGIATGTADKTAVHAVTGRTEYPGQTFELVSICCCMPLFQVWVSSWSSALDSCFCNNRQIMSAACHIVT